MHDVSWQIGAWGGFICILLAANALAHDVDDQALMFLAGGVVLLLWAAWAGRVRPPRG
jgi:hypothetical protein